MEGVSVVEDVEEIEHEGDVLEEGAHAFLGSPFPVGSDHPGELEVGIGVGAASP
jgi:hypothetical protein